MREEVPTMPGGTAATVEQVNAYLLDPARTVEELTAVLGVVKARLDDASMAGQVRTAFEDASAEADAIARARFK
jgi:hypothetical protein